MKVYVHIMRLLYTSNSKMNCELDDVDDSARFIPL